MTSLKEGIASMRKTIKSADRKVVAGIRRKRENLPDGSAKHFYQKQLDGSATHHYQNESDVSANRRKLCISIGIIVIGLIVLAGAAVGIYFVAFPPSASTSGTTASALSPVLDEDGLLAYEAICVPQYITSSPTPNVSWNECIAGPPPRHDSCSGRATCIIYQYEAVYSVNRETIVLKDRSMNVTMEYNKDIVPKRKKNASQLLCRTTSDELGLCNGSTCTGARVKDKRSWYEESRWEDNCDQPNPCWKKEEGAIERLSIQYVTRADCLKMNTTVCRQSNYLSVIVWMQHLRCDSGKDRSRRIPCPGYPLKLWICANCNRSITPMDYVNDQCDHGAPTVVRVYACGFRCTRKGASFASYFTLVDGAACLNGTDRSVNTGYCFKGTCWQNLTVLDVTNRHELEKTGCRNKTLK